MFLLVKTKKKARKAQKGKVGTWMHARGPTLSWTCAPSPQPSILSRGSSWYDFGDEDAGVVAHMRVVCPSCYAEAKAWVTLREKMKTNHFSYFDCSFTETVVPAITNKTEPQSKQLRVYKRDSLSPVWSPHIRFLPLSHSPVRKGLVDLINNKNVLKMKQLHIMMSKPKPSNVAIITASEL